MSVDLRTRSDEDLSAVDPHAFFSTELPAILDARQELLEAGAARLRLQSFSVEIEGEVWSLESESDRVRMHPGTLPEAAHLKLAADELTRLVHDQCTPMTFFTGGTLDMPRGGLGDFLDWWLVLRAALDGRRLHTRSSYRRALAT